MKAKSELAITKWDETKCGQAVNDMVVVRASVAFVTSGAIDGTFEVEYLLHYTNFDEANPHNSNATYVGFITFSGSIGGQRGSFVLEDKGDYTPAGPVSELKIKPGTGVGGFAGIAGTGRYFAEGEKMVIEIEYSL